MTQSKQDDLHDAMVDFMRDVYIALTGEVKRRILTDAEIFILNKGSDLLQEFTDNPHATH